MNNKNNQYPNLPNNTKLKQCIVVNCDELYIINLLFKLSEHPSLVWARNIIETRITDEENTIIEADLGWEIRVRGNPNEIGRLQINEYEIGVLINYWSKTDDGWNVVNEFMDQLFTQLKLDGYTVVPRNNQPIKVQLKELKKKFIKRLPSQDNGIGISSMSVKRKNPCDELLPKKKSTITRWKKIYQVVLGTRYKYLEDYKDARSDLKRGFLASTLVAIAGELKITISERTLRKIIEAGEKGCLK